MRKQFFFHALDRRKNPMPNYCFYFTSDDASYCPPSHQRERIEADTPVIALDMLKDQSRVPASSKVAIFTEGEFPSVRVVALVTRPTN